MTIQVSIALCYDWKLIVIKWASNLTFFSAQKVTKINWEQFNQRMKMKDQLVKFNATTWLKRSSTLEKEPIGEDTGYKHSSCLALSPICHTI